MSDNHQPAPPIPRRFSPKTIKLVLLILLILIVGVVVFAAITLPPMDRWDGPHDLLLSYSEQGQVCQDRIEVYRDGRITYFCQYEQVAADTVPPAQMTRLLDAATRLPFGTTSNLTIPYSLSFHGSGQQPSAADHEAVQQIAHDLLIFMRQKYP